MVAREVADARGALRSGRNGENAEVTASYGSGGYLDRSGRCRDGTGCRGQRDGALRLSEVGGLHGRADGIGHSGWHWPRRMATATAGCIDRSGIDHSAGQCESPVGVGVIAREPAGESVQADDGGMVWKIGRTPRDIRSNIRWNIRWAVLLGRVSVQSTTDM